MKQLPVSLKNNIMDILLGSRFYWRKKFNIVLVDIREFHILHFLIKWYLQYSLPNKIRIILSSQKNINTLPEILLSLWNNNSNRMEITKLYSYHRDKRLTPNLIKKDSIFYKDLIYEIDIFMQGGKSRRGGR